MAATRSTWSCDESGGWRRWTHLPVVVAALRSVRLDEKVPILGSRCRCGAQQVSVPGPDLTWMSLGTGVDSRCLARPPWLGQRCELLAASSAWLGRGCTWCYFRQSRFLTCDPEEAPRRQLEYAATYILDERHGRYAGAAL